MSLDSAFSYWFSLHIPLQIKGPISASYFLPVKHIYTATRSPQFSLTKASFKSDRAVLQIIYLGTLSGSYFILYPFFPLRFQMLQELCMQTLQVNYAGICSKYGPTDLQTHTALSKEEEFYLLSSSDPLQKMVFFPSNSFSRSNRILYFSIVSSFLLCAFNSCNIIS